MKEKDIHPKLAKIVKENKIQGVFELKLEKGKSMPFNKVEEHQIEALLCARDFKGIYHKINDHPFQSGTSFTNRKPFDSFYISNYPAYVVICFYVPRKKKIFYFLDIYKFLYLKENLPRKSLPEDVANEHAEIVINTLTK